MKQDLSNQPIRVGLAGCGSIAPSHIRALQTLPHIELAGLADPDQAAACRIRSLWLKGAAESPSGEPNYYKDLMSLLRLEKPQVVHICTPHQTHVPLAVEALDAGCHVLLEKPPAITLADLAVLKQAAARAGKTVGVCFQNRYLPASRQARHLLQSGKAGPVRAARAFVTWKRDAAYYAQAPWRGRWATEGGGVMINQAIHTLDLLIWLAGRPASVVGTIANRHLRHVIEVEDTAEMQLTLENGVTALFYATTAYAADAPVFLELDCTDCRLRLEGDRLELLDSKGQPLPDARLQALLGREPAYVAPEQDCRPAAQQGKACWGNGHQPLVRAFYESLQPDGPPFLVDLANGSLALQTLLALYASDQAKTVVAIE